MTALLLARSDIRALMTVGDWLEAVEGGFRALHDGQAEAPPPLSLETASGGFHAKAASLALGERRYVALKLNGNFPGNPDRTGLPTVQGAILLHDGSNGSLLAIIDSIEVTLRRTAAATALAARHLARPESRTLTVCGCGAQAGPQLEALRGVLPVAVGWCWDSDPDRAQAFASAAGLEVAGRLVQATLQSDVIVTCTSATAPFLTAAMVRPGTFIAAVGADNPHKSEIADELMASALVVVDSLDQCAAMGDLRHAVAAGRMTPADIHAELGQLVAGARPGRTDGSQVTLFDSTGVAVQDVASAALIYQRAVASGAGRPVDLSA